MTLESTELATLRAQLEKCQRQLGQQWVGSVEGIAEENKRLAMELLDCYRILDLIKCPVHGRCVSHVLSTFAEMTAELARLRENPS